VIPFRIDFRPGVSLYEQIVYAATKAIISRHLRPGDAFPSVRLLSRELKINPNTAHKVIAHLITVGLLETRPGIGTVVAALPESTKSERTQLLGHEIEQLVVEAKKMGISLEEILASISAHWKRLDSNKTPTSPYREGRSR
jgi:GntR family transcriptional regulator